jgi:hypothetical protein
LKLGGAIFLPGMSLIGNIATAASMSGIYAKSNINDKKDVTVYTPDGKEINQEAIFAELQSENLQTYLVNQVQKNLTECNISVSSDKKITDSENLDPRATSNWYKAPETYLINKNEVNPKAVYLIETRISEIKTTSTYYGDDVRVITYVKLFKLPKYDYVDKFTFSTTGYKYLKHYKNDDPEKNDELMTEIKNLLDLRGKEMANEVCDATMTYYMSDSGQRVYVPRK